MDGLVSSLSKANPRESFGDRREKTAPHPRRRFAAEADRYTQLEVFGKAGGTAQLGIPPHGASDAMKVAMDLRKGRYDEIIVRRVRDAAYPGRTQAEHHRLKTVREEYWAFLDRHGIPSDEKYLGDRGVAYATRENQD